MKSVLSSLFVFISSIFNINQYVQAMCFIQDVGCLAPLILGEKYSASYGSAVYDKEWSASWGRVYSINRGIVFAFCLDQEAIEILHSNDLLALEFDFIVRGSSRNDFEVNGVSKSDNLNDARVGYDTTAFDSVTNNEDTRTIGAHLLNPQALRVGELYIIVITTKGDLPTSDISFTPSIQLTLNLVKIANPSSFFGSLGFIIASDIGDFFDQFKYFVLETDSYNKSFVPGSGCKVTWDNHKYSELICGGFNNSDSEENQLPSENEQILPENNEPVEGEISDEGYIDPVINHKHAIGLHSVRYSLSGEDNWHYGTASIAQGTDQNADIRVKVEEKEGRSWENVCIYLYYSDNHWFSRSHDQLVESSCIEILSSNESRSRYFNNLKLTELDEGNYYFFADIRYGDDHNISSRDDDSEYVKIEVGPMNPSKQWSKYTEAEKAAILRIILQ